MEFQKTQEQTSSLRISRTKKSRPTRRHSHGNKSTIAAKKDGVEVVHVTDRLIVVTANSLSPSDDFHNQHHQPLHQSTELFNSIDGLFDCYSEKLRIINLSDRRFCGPLAHVKYSQQIVDFGWPDQFIPSLERIFQIVNSVHFWLQDDAQNVVVIYCQGNETRIGLFLACYVNFSRCFFSHQRENWCHLTRYYSSKLQSLMSSSQKRYIGYFNSMLQQRHKPPKVPLVLKTMIMHNLPVMGDGLYFHLKIYQGYHLVHTTETWFIPEDCNIFLLRLEKKITLRGDVMIQCVQRTSNTDSVILFSVQFHTGGVTDRQSVFGKYQLDSGVSTQALPSYFELVFVDAPERDLIGGTMATPQHDYQASDQHQFRFRHHSSSSTDKSKIQNQYNNLQQGIEALDGFLDDLGYISDSSKNSMTNVSQVSAKHNDLNNNNNNNNNMQAVKAQMSLPLKKLNSLSADDAFSNSSNLSTTSILNEILSDLDRSPLNTSNRGGLTPRLSERTKNGSFYDNGIPTNDDQQQQQQILTPLTRTRIDSMEEEIEEIEAGTVHKHVKALNSVLFKKPSGDYKDRYGIPLAGYNSPEVVEERVSAFNAFLMTHNFTPCKEEGDNERSPQPDSAPRSDDENPQIMIVEKAQSSRNITLENSHNPRSFTVENDDQRLPQYHKEKLSEKSSRDLIDSLDDLMEITADPKGHRPREILPANRSKLDNYSPKINYTVINNKSNNNRNATTAQQPAAFSYRTIAPTFYSSSSSSSSKSSSIKSQKSDSENDLYKSEDVKKDREVNHIDQPLGQQESNPDTRHDHVHATDQAYHTTPSVDMAGDETQNSDPMERCYLEKSIVEEPQQKEQEQVDLNNNDVSLPNSFIDDYSTPTPFYQVPKSLDNDKGDGGRSHNNNNTHYESINRNHIPTFSLLPPEQQGTEHTKNVSSNSLPRGTARPGVNEDLVQSDANAVESLYAKPVKAFTAFTKDPFADHRTRPNNALPNGRGKVEEQSRCTDIVEIGDSTDNGLKGKCSIIEVTEEPTKPTLVQQELACLNEDIIKNLLDEDLLVKPSNSTSSIPTSSVGSRPASETPTYASSEEDSNFTGTFYNGSMLYSTPQRTMESAISPPSPRRFPPMMQSLKMTTTTLAPSDEFSSTSVDGSSPIYPLNVGTLTRNHHRHHNNNNNQHLRTRTISNGSSISDEGVSPVTSPTSTFGRTHYRRFKSSGSSTSSISSTSEIFQEVLRYPAIKFDKDTVDLWYRPNISREQATSILRDSEPGSFLVRDSQTYEGAFGLAVKVDTPPASVLKQVNGDVSKIDLDNELVRHFLIEPSKKGVRLKGSNEEPAFPSLVALIYQHSLTRMALPITLTIPYRDSVDGPPSSSAADNRLSKVSESQLLAKGAACDLLYLGGVKVDTLTGDGAVQYAMNKVTSLATTLKTTIVNIKVNQEGITLTDNNRRMFFRQHFQMTNVLHCGVDPKSRKVNLKTFANRNDKDAGCFGFVVQNEQRTENHCYVLAELEQDQPASAVINFIHKAMRYARV